MTQKPKVPVIGEALRGTVAYAVRSREGLRAGLRDAQAARLHPPPVDEHAHRFLYGFTLPITLLRMAWADNPIRRSLVHRLMPPLMVVSLFAVIGVVSLTTDLFAARHEPTSLAADVDEDDDRDERRPPPVAKADPERTESSRRSTEAQAARRGRDHRDHDDADEVLQDTHEVIGAAQGALDDMAESMREAREETREAARTIHSAQALGDDPPPPRTAKPRPPERFPALHAVLKFVESRIAQLIAGLGVLEWILVWIGREHHDQISYEIARLTGVPGEPLSGPPRLRFDFAWVRMKGWRALRFLIFVALASPVAWVVGKIPLVGGALAVVVEAGWAAYWASVFGIANSFLCWARPLAPDEAPWFIRLLRRGEQIPILGVVCRLYARILTWATRNVWPACMAFERTTWEAAGLASLRAIMSIPILYLVSRPAFGPAATHVWIGRMPADPGGSTPGGSNLSAPAS